MSKPSHNKPETRLVYSTDTGDMRKASDSATAQPSGTQQSTQGQVRVWLDTKSRRGKAMTRVTGIRHNPQVIEELAKALKVLCGAGGTVEDGDILVQGDHRDRIAARLGQQGYKVRKI